MTNVQRLDNSIQQDRRLERRLGDLELWRRNVNNAGGIGGGSGSATLLDSWHTVNSDSGLSTAYINGWSGSFKFRKDPFGRVWIKGSGTGPSGQDSFVLPLGYRPSEDYYYDNLQDGGIDGTYIFVGANGTVNVTKTQTTAFIDLSFDTGTVTEVFTGPQGQVGPTGPAGLAGVNDFYASLNMKSGQAAFTIAAAWTQVLIPDKPILTITKSDGVNDDFTRNTDGSITILKAGNYNIAAAISNNAAQFTDNQAVDLVIARKNGSLPALTDAIASDNVTMSNSVNNFAWPAAFVSTPCAVGDRIALWAWCSASFSFVLYTFSIVRTGTGPVGPQGPAGAVGGNATVPMESTHIVGNVGEIAFASNWTLWQSVGYRKDPLGKVLIFGTVKSVAAWAYGAASGVLFTLPAGYRPTRDMSYRASCFQPDGSTAFISQVNVAASTGNVALSTNITNPSTGGLGQASTYVKLDVIEFDTETVTQMPTGPQGIQGPQAPPSLVSTLPAGSADGTEIYYMVAGVNQPWQLRKRLASMIWDWVGGAPITSGPLGSTGTVSNTSAVAIPSGPSITVPAAGVYLLTFGGFLQSYTAGLANLYIGVLKNNVPISGGMTCTMIVQTTYDGSQLFVSWPSVTLAAGDVLKLWSQTSSVQYAATGCTLTAQPLYLNAT